MYYSFPSLMESSFVWLLSIMVAVSLISILVFFVGIALVWIGKFKVFQKYGESGWKALIPIYGEWVLFDIFAMKTEGIIYLTCLFVSFLLKDNPEAESIYNLMMVVQAIMLILCYSKVAQSFRYNSLMALGLWALPFIFWPILGLNTKVGNQYRVRGSYFDNFFKSNTTLKAESVLQKEEEKE